MDPRLRKDLGVFDLIPILQAGSTASLTVSRSLSTASRDKASKLG